MRTTKKLLKSKKLFYISLLLINLLLTLRYTLRAKGDDITIVSDKVLIDESEEAIEGENIKTNIGIISLKGGQLKRDKEHFYIKDARVTTCSPCLSCDGEEDKALWEITAKEASIDQDYINLSKARVSIYGNKITPAIDFRIPKKNSGNQTGFLPIKIYSIRKFGPAVKIPYYVSIKNNLDLYFAPHLSLHPKFEFNFRHMPLKNLKYDLTYINSIPGQNNRYFVKGNLGINLQNKGFAYALLTKSNKYDFFREELDIPFIRNRYGIVLNEGNAYLNIEREEIEDLTEGKSDPEKSSFSSLNFRYDGDLKETKSGLDSQRIFSSTLRDELVLFKGTQTITKTNAFSIASNLYLYKSAKHDVALVPEVEASFSKSFITTCNDMVARIKPFFGISISGEKDSSKFDKFVFERYDYLSRESNESDYPRQSHINYGATVSMMPYRGFMAELGAEGRVWIANKKDKKNQKSSYHSDVLAPHKLKVRLSNNNKAWIEANISARPTDLKPVRYQIISFFTARKASFSFAHSFVDKKYYNVYERMKGPNKLTSNHYTEAKIRYNLSNNTRLFAGTESSYGPSPHLSLGVEHSINCGKISIELAKKEAISLKVSLSVPLF